jgi:class 3 adenylate cyclase/TolB-like protein/Tfp pilus assembly protein PilF
LSTERVERRLTAILAADVAGYSRLTGQDEEGTHLELKHHLATLLEPKIAEYRGRVVKNTGDGMLAEFGSVVDAVRCAFDIQHGMAERNADVPPDKRIDFRIGINVGDIITDDGDIFGDGVNVAARLEGIAEPGGICISGAAYEQVRDKVPFAFADRGEQSVKNIAHPVHVYALGVNEAAGKGQPRTRIETPRSTERPARRLRSAIAYAAGGLAIVAIVLWFAVGLIPGRPGSGPAPRFSMLVLPFANLSGDPAQDYLADIITEELTTSLSRIRHYFVIARSTAFTYKGKAIDVKQIGRDLGVRYVLEGSEQQGGNRVRVSAQLIDAGTGAYLWADQFDADRADLLEMQDEIVTRLSRALQVRLVEIDASRVARAHPGDLDAEDLAMRCEAAIVNARAGSDEEGRAYDLCERALQRDGRNVRALVNLSFKFIVPVLNIQSLDREGDIRRAEELVSRALAIDPNSYGAHHAKAEVLLAQKRFEEAIVEEEHSLALNPSFVSAYTGLCTGSSFLGQPQKAVEYADKAIRLSPRDPLLYVFHLSKGFALSLLHQDDEAIEWLRRAVAAAPQWPLPQALLASSLAMTGHEPEASETLKRYLSLSATRAKTIALWRKQMPSDNPVFLAYAARLVEGLRKAGLPE